MNEEWHAHTRNHYRSSPPVNRWELGAVALLVLLGVLSTIYHLAVWLFH